MMRQAVVQLCRQAWHSAGLRAAMSHTERRGRLLSTARVPSEASNGILGLSLLSKKISTTIAAKLQQDADAVMAAAGQDSSASRRRVAPIQPGQLEGDLYQSIAEVAGQLYAEGHVPCRPNVGQVNQYLSGGGCPMHIDARGVGAAIAMVSLGSPAVLDLIPEKRYTTLIEKHGEEEAAAAAANDDELMQVLLEPLSVVILGGESRYHWLHGIQEGSLQGDRTSIVLWSTDPDPDAPPFKKPTGTRQAILATVPTKRAAFKLPGS